MGKYYREEEIRMFEVGDKIVHPMHGAGVIESVENKTILGEEKQYYQIKMMLRGIEISIPVDRIDEIGLREVMDEGTKQEMLDILGGKMGDMPKNWNQRYRANMESIKTGDVLELAEVVRNLYLLDIKKGLSAGEKKMLNTAKQMLLSELVILEDKPVEEIEKKIDKIIEDMPE